MVQIRTSKRTRLRSMLDPRWLAAFAVGLMLSLAYYGLLIWGVVWLFRAVVAVF